MIAKDDFNLLDPALKDEAWAKRIVTYMVYNRMRLTHGKDVLNLRLWQNSQYDVTPFKQPYLHILPKSEGGELEEDEAKSALKIDFSQLGLFELPKSVLSGEINKEKINIDCDCIDPTILSDKEKEFDLFKNKKLIQNQVNKLYQGIGVKSDFQIGKQGEFNSNINDFDAMGLNVDSPEDIEFFANTFYRHDLETDSTAIINQINSMNELSEIQKLHIDDLISVKCLSMQTYYNTNTGLPSNKYLAPEIVYYTGKVSRNDFKDANSLHWEDDMSIGDFLKMVGDEQFSKEDYTELLMWSGQGELYPLGIDFFNIKDRPEKMCDLQTYFRFNIRVGYIEWKTTDRNEVGRYFQKTMKAYYVSNISVPQKLYKFGYLNVMAREGYESELSNFSICAYRIDGFSILEISIPYFKRIFSNWLRYQYFMESAKPKGYAYEINSLRRVAKEILNGNGSWNDVIAMMKMFKKSPDMFYSAGDEEAESKLGGNGLPYQEKTNGIDPSAEQFLKSIEWLEAKIMRDTGLNNARIAQSPSPEEAYKKTQLVTDQSENATEYIASAINNVYSGSAYRTFFIVQSIIEFDLFGIEQIKHIFSERYVRVVEFMKRIPIQYFGITIRRFLRDREREELRNITNAAVINGSISEEIAILINNIDDYQKAAAVLSYYKTRARKLAQQDALAIEKAKQSTMQLAHQNKMEEIQLTNKGLLDKQIEVNKGLILVAQTSGESKIKQQQVRIDSIPSNKNQEHIQKLEQETHEAALETTQELIKPQDGGNKSK